MASKKIQDYIWFEKYRPTSLDEMSMPADYADLFNSYIDEQEIPHILLEGPHGSGKTTTAYILLKEIKNKRLILNASGRDRGIETMRGKIVQFATSQTIGGEIKIVMLDEADALTPEAQDALRNTMETYSKYCRFILTCNHVDKIIPPIQSRTTRFTFNSIPQEKALKLCLKILKKENVKFSKSDKPIISKLIEAHDTDMRSVINELQMASSSGIFEKSMLPDLLVDMGSVWDAVMKGHVATLRKEIASVKSFIFAYRFFFDNILEKHAIPDEAVIESIYAIAEASARENIVPDREINFVSCALSIMEAIGVKPDRSK